MVCQACENKKQREEKEEAEFLGWPFKCEKARRIYNFIRMAISLVLVFTGTGLKDALPSWAFYTMVISSYVLISYDIFIAWIFSLKEGSFLDEHFLMMIGTIGAFIISSYNEAVFVMVFYQFGEILEDFAEARSKKSIAGLVNDMPLKAHLLQEDGTIKEVTPQDLKKGDKIKILPGEKIPVDGLIAVGRTSLDMSSLTGESLPMEVDSVNNDKVYSGSINKEGAIVILVEKEFKDSTLSGIMDLIQKEEGNKAKSERFIDRFAKVYTPIVVLLALVTFVVIYGWDGWGLNYSRALYDACNMLIIACPCALIISIPLCFFISIGRSSKDGILVKGGSALESFSRATAFVFDKTGTITQGQFKVINYKDEETLALMAALEANSTHPIALSIAESYKEKTGKKEFRDVKDFVNIPGQGIIGTIDDVTYYLGDEDFIKKEAQAEAEVQDNPYKNLYLAKKGRCLGYVTIADTIKPEAKKAITMLKSEGVKRTIMLSGDNKEIALKAGKEAGLDEEYGDLLPQDKTKMVKELKKECPKGVIYVGDGVNDAPSLLAADCGVAMGGLGADAAKESADVVILNDNLNKVSLTRKISKKTMKVVYENIVLILAIKVAVLILAGLSISNMYLAAIADTGTTLLAVINATRLGQYRKKTSNQQSEDKKKTV